MMPALTLACGTPVLVSERDVELVLQFKWWRHENKRNGHVYAKTEIREPHPLWPGRVIRRALYMHRLITDAPKGMLVDHRDHHTLNNQRSNLRICTYRMNGANREVVNATGFKGVQRARNGMFTARITEDGRLVHLGTFATAEDAARAYDQRAMEIFSEFAWFNFPPAEEMMEEVPF